MKLMIIMALGAAVLATPCIYDVRSEERSPLAGLVAAASGSAVELAPIKR